MIHHFTQYITSLIISRELKSFCLIRDRAKKINSHQSIEAPCLDLDEETMRALYLIEGIHTRLAGAYKYLLSKKFQSLIDRSGCSLPDYCNPEEGNLRPIDLLYSASRDPHRRLAAADRAIAAGEAVAYYSYKPGPIKPGPSKRPIAGGRKTYAGGTDRSRGPSGMAGTVTVKVTHDPHRDYQISRPPSHRASSWDGQVVTGRSAQPKHQQYIKQRLKRGSNGGVSYRSTSMSSSPKPTSDRTLPGPGGSFPVHTPDWIADIVARAAEKSRSIG